MQKVHRQYFHTLRWGESLSCLLMRSVLKIVSFPPFSRHWYTKPFTFAASRLWLQYNCQSIEFQFGIEENCPTIRCLAKLPFIQYRKIESLNFVAENKRYNFVQSTLLMLMLLLVITLNQSDRVVVSKDNLNNYCFQTEKFMSLLAAYTR